MFLQPAPNTPHLTPDTQCLWRSTMNSVRLNGGAFPVIKLLFGLTLFFAGTLATIASLGLVELDSVRRLAPAILILLGIAMEADSLRRGRFGCGIVFVGVGTWLL